MSGYRTIVADPPWPAAGDCDYRSRPWASKGGRRGRDTFFPYATMTLEDIHGLDVADFAETDAHLYLWVTAGLNRVGVGVSVAQAWGFKVVSEIVWSKPSFGLGKFPRPQHEIILVCRLGSLPFAVNNAGSVQVWQQPRGKGNGGKTHSAKPDGFLDLVERASPGPYLELFARRQRLGWDTWGDEALNHVEFERVTSAAQVSGDVELSRDETVDAEKTGSAAITTCLSRSLGTTDSSPSPEFGSAEAALPSLASVGETE